MSRVIPLEHFSSTNTVELARELLGKKLVITQADCTQTRHLITETEAYDGPEDLACHASKGRTARTEVLFGPPGHWYVYLVYGMHEMLNLVTGPADYPAAILLRGLEGIVGPGRLTKHLGINRRFNTLPAVPTSNLHIEDATRIPDSKVDATPRIGIDYAGPDWSQRPYRFVVKP